MPVFFPRGLALDFFDNDRVSLDWPRDPPLSTFLASGGTQLILNMVLMGVDSLPRGGSVCVRLADIPEGGTGVAIIAAGVGARLRDDLQDAMFLTASMDVLTARNVHGHLAALLAKSFGTDLEASVHQHGENQQDEVRFAALIPHEE